MKQQDLANAVANGERSFEQHKAQLVALENWSLAGKLAVISPEKRASVYINWHQTNRNTQINLTNLLGVSLAKIDDNGLRSVMESDGNTYIESSPDALIYQVTGWQLPVSQLKTWIKGLPFDKDDIVIDANKVVEQILPACTNCDSWSINYEKYRLVSNIQLPHRIKMIHSDTKTRLTFSISQWKLSPGKSE